MSAFVTKDQLMPLRGPVGWRDVFFERGASEVLKYVRVRRSSQWILGVVSACGLGLMAWIYHQLGQSEYTDVMVVQMFAWGLIEFVCWCHGFGLEKTARPAGRRQLAELALTQLRPIEVAQLFIARSVWPLALPLIVLTAGMSLIQYARFTSRPYTVIPVVLIGVNTWITLYTFKWMQTSLYLSATSVIRAAWRQLMFMAAYALYTFWMVVVCFGVALLIDKNDVGSLTMAWIASMAGLFWWMKYRFAKAWAVHLERAVFHRVEM